MQILFLTFILLLSGCGSFEVNHRDKTNSPDTQLQQSEDTVTESKETLALALALDRHLKSSPKVSAIVFVTKGEQTLYKKSFGFANFETRQQHSIDTLYESASISKSLTGAVAVFLAQQGNLNLDARMDQFYSVTGATAGITVRELLNHTSGLQYVDLPQSEYDRNENTPSTLFTSLLRQARVENPGRFQYNNEAYNLLAHIIQVSASQNHDDYLTSIFRSLGLNHSGINRHSSIDPNLPAATGYMNGDPTFIAGRLPNSWSDRGASAWVTTARELTQFVRTTIKNRNWLNQQSLNELIAPPTGGDYALGWGIDRSTTDNSIVVSHTGEFEGYLTVFRYHADSDTCYVALSNVAESSEAIISGAKLIIP